MSFRHGNLHNVLNHGNLHNVLRHRDLHNVLKYESLHNVLNQVTRTDRSGFRKRLQTVLLQSVGTILARAPISIVSVGFLPPHQQLEVCLQQLVVASPQDHQVPEEAHRTSVAIPSVNNCCAGQGQLCPHDHHRTFKQCRRVFLEVQDQAAKHRAVPIQVQHCFPRPDV